MAQRSLIFRVHAIERMFQRGIRVEEVRLLIEKGEVIESYPDDNPYPSRLILGWHEGRPLHAVVADPMERNETIIITIYHPDPERWDNDFKRRKA